MKVVKDNIIDKDLYYKMIDSKVQEDYWRAPLKEAFDQCREPIMADVAKIQKAFSDAPFNIKKDVCDAQYLAMFMCIHVDSFVVRFFMMKIFYVLPSGLIIYNRNVQRRHGNSKAVMSIHHARR